jgi:hypothetical protein
MFHFQEMAYSMISFHIVAAVSLMFKSHLNENDNHSNFFEVTESISIIFDSFIYIYPFIICNLYKYIRQISVRVG